MGKNAPILSLDARVVRAFVALVSKAVGLLRSGARPGHYKLVVILES